MSVDDLMDRLIHDRGLPPEPSRAPSEHNDAPFIEAIVREDGPWDLIDVNAIAHKLLEMGLAYLSPKTYWTKVVTDNVGDGLGKGIAKVGEGIGGGVQDSLTSLPNANAWAAVAVACTATMMGAFVLAMVALKIRAARRAATRDMTLHDMPPEEARALALARANDVCLDRIRTLEANLADSQKQVVELCGSLLRDKTTSAITSPSNAPTQIPRTPSLGQAPPPLPPTDGGGTVSPTYVGENMPRLRKRAAAAGLSQADLGQQRLRADLVAFCAAAGLPELP